METGRIMKNLFLVLIFAFGNVCAFASDIKTAVKSNEYLVEKEDRGIYPNVFFDFSMEGFYDNLKPEGKNSKDRFSIESTLLIDITLNKNFGIRSKSKLKKIKGEPENSLILFDADYFQKNESPFFGTSLTTAELSLFFQFDRATIFIGKIEPKFGGGSERGSNIFYEDWYGTSGNKINTSYDLDEKLGVLARIYVVQTTGTNIIFEGSIFQNDSSNLYKKPFLEHREILGFTTPFTTKRIAGEKTSHAISIQGFTALTKRDVIAFGVGYKNQFSSDYGREHGGVVDFQYVKTFFQDFTVSIFSEAAVINNAYAISDVKEHFFTNGIASSFAGFKVGVVQNDYNIKMLENKESLKALEYFAGFEVPKTELGFFISYKKYDIADTNYNGFGMNVRYRIR